MQMYMRSLLRCPRLIIYFIIYFYPKVCFEKANEPELVKKAEACLVASQAYAATDEQAAKPLFLKAAQMFKSAAPHPEHLVT